MVVSGMHASPYAVVVEQYHRGDITEDSLFVNIGERTNITGSARFRNLIKAEVISDLFITPHFSRADIAADILMSPMKKLCLTD